METNLSRISLTWRDGQQLLIAAGRRVLHVSSMASSFVSRAIASRKSYPSQRPCPVCEEKTSYRASWATFFTGLYTRTCRACGYCDSKKVKMIKQL